MVLITIVTGAYKATYNWGYIYIYYVYLSFSIYIEHIVDI